MPTIRLSHYLKISLSLISYRMMRDEFLKLDENLQRRRAKLDERLAKKTAASSTAAKPKPKKASLKLGKAAHSAANPN